MKNMRLLCTIVWVVFLGSSLLAQSPPDRDYDGVPDEFDQCPDIFGSSKTVGCPDTDEDGIKDMDDKCPEVAGFANLMGCMDSDYDGIIDPDDECPDVYAETETGCPGIGANDNDGDGIPNAEDLCPDEAGLFTANGCPDRDGDGVQDALDLCPDYYGVLEYTGCPMPKEQLDEMRRMIAQARREEAMGIRNYVGTDGGTKVEDRFGNVLDTDSDGNLVTANGQKVTTEGGYTIEEGLIKDRSGTTVRIGIDGNIYAAGNLVATEGNLMAMGTNPDPSGNPGSIMIGVPFSDNFAGDSKLTGFPYQKELSPEEEEYCQRLDLASLRSAIYFDYDDGKADASSLRRLNTIVEAMRKCAVLELQIAGHTDSDGPDTYNLQLSERRAQSVLRYITGKGINDRRLKYNAYGEKYPMKPNIGQGKAQNRRAEVRVLRTY